MEENAINVALDAYNVLTILLVLSLEKALLSSATTLAKDVIEDV